MHKTNVEALFSLNKFHFFYDVWSFSFLSTKKRILYILPHIRDISIYDLIHTKGNTLQYLLYRFNYLFCSALILELTSY